MKNDTQEKIGKTFISADRDAIHIAVLPAKAHKNLCGGVHVGFQNGETTETEYIGIIDPFLASVKQGECCFIFLYPNSITSLRHQWVHPSILDGGQSIPDKEVSEKWLREFAASADCPDYETLIAAATGATLGSDNCTYTNDGEYLTFYGRDAHGEIPPEFWSHVQIVSGVKIPASLRAECFSCSC